MTSIDIYTILSSKHHNQHYLKRYLKFIESCSGSGKVKHHICPQSMFPEYKFLKDHPWNCSLLSERHHFIAHWMLHKALGSKMSRAFKFMCNLDQPLITSRVYSKLLLNVRSIGFSDEHKAKISKANKGKILSDETKSKMSEVNKGKTLSEETKSKISKSSIGKIMSEEARAKMSIAKKGKLASDETRAKMSKSAMGKIMSDEARAKISISRRGKKASDEARAKMSKSKSNLQKLKCPHCGKEATQSCLTRYHLDNCKFLSN